MFERVTPVAIVVVTGCFAASAPVGQPCSTTNAECPPGQTCVEGTCQDDGSGIAVCPAKSLGSSIDPGRGPAILIPAGSFQMGCEIDGDDPHCPIDGDESPSNHVYVSTYCIDKFEVTQERYQVCVDSGPCQAPAHEDYDPATRPNWPVASVLWQDAFDFCEWIGRRLPTEAEWERAARGDADVRRYPWGDTEPTCALAHLNDCPGGDDPIDVGLFSAAVSPFGVHNMAGNVSEWVNDWRENTYLQQSTSDPRGPSEGSGKVVRGGSFRASNNAEDARVASRHSGTLVEEYSDRGFRCAETP